MEGKDAGAEWKSSEGKSAGGGGGPPRVDESKLHDALRIASTWVRTYPPIMFMLATIARSPMLIFPRAPPSPSTCSSSRSSFPLFASGATERER